MAREVTGKSLNPIGSLAALVFSALFAVSFGAGGYWFGLKPLVQTLRAALEVRGWQPVQAEVLSADLTSHSDRAGDDATWRVQALYRYTFAGRPYEGSRVGLDAEAGADNIGDWHQRWQTQLQGAKASGQPVTVLVNPRNPSQSLIDPDIRWQMLAFRLPFAFVFTGVGLAAAWIFVLVLWGLFRPSGAADRDKGDGAQLPHASGGQRSASKSVGGIWFFCLFWCGLVFPMAGILWSTERTPWLPKALMGLFVAVGLGLLAYALRQTHRAWRYAGAGLTATPPQPYAGQPVEISLLLPERAAAYQHGKDLHLRLAQYRVDTSSSGSPERRVESFTQPARVQPTADGGLRLAARFDLPSDAPPHGARRSGEQVDWRLELLRGPKGDVQLTYDLPVQAALQGFGITETTQPDDRFDIRAIWNQVTRIEPPGETPAGEEGLPQMSATVGLYETQQGWRYTFSRSGWRWAAGLVLAGLAIEAVLHDRLGTRGLVPPRGFFAAFAWWALAAFALHAATCRWALTVHDAGITVRRSSWLWSRTDILPGQSSQALAHKLLYTTGSGESENRYYAVYAQVGDQADLVQLTPGIRGDTAATALGQSLAQAWAHRKDHFSPGAQRDARAGYAWRPAWGALLLGAALAWSIWGAVPTDTAAAASRPSAAEPSVVYSSVDGRLLDAQNAGDAPALRDALAAGANPNLLAPTGSSVLMLAAHRGQLEHITALLDAGAQVDLRQTQKDSERGDTALLRAFYGGHLAAAQRLVQAGGSLSARNRWDWGPLHMAAQSGCIPCMDWLAEQGQSLDEPAPASRGETPAMLAAAKGRVEALQWFEARGVDLARRDTHGNTALDWARFKQQDKAEHWLAQRPRRGGSAVLPARVRLHYTQPQLQPLVACWTWKSSAAIRP